MVTKKGEAGYMPLTIRVNLRSNKKGPPILELSVDQAVALAKALNDLAAKKMEDED